MKDDETHAFLTLDFYDLLIYTLDDVIVTTHTSTTI